MNAALDFAKARELMVEQQVRPWDVLDVRVLDVLAALPREAFVPPAYRDLAYSDMELPLAHGERSHKPVFEGRALQALALEPGDSVLEIGTGCGYQAAVLSRVAKEVYSVERVAPLLAKARKHFRELRVSNVRLRHADGQLGMPEVAPFDAILISASATHVPRELLAQLEVGGRMILPMRRGGEQRLWMIERSAHGYVEKKMDAVKFVPLLPGLA